jgi:hypothetical protein
MRRLWFNNLPPFFFQYRFEKAGVGHRQKPHLLVKMAKAGFVRREFQAHEPLSIDAQDVSVGKNENVQPFQKPMHYRCFSWVIVFV